MRYTCGEGGRHRWTHRLGKAWDAEAARSCALPTFKMTLSTSVPTGEYRILGLLVMRCTRRPRLRCSLLVKPNELMFPCRRASGSIVLRGEILKVKGPRLRFVGPKAKPPWGPSPVVPAEDGLQAGPELHEGRALPLRILGWRLALGPALLGAGIGARGEVHS